MNIPSTPRFQNVTRVSFLLLFLIIGLNPAGDGRTLQAQPLSEESILVNLRLPTEGAGVGTIAVRLYAPSHPSRFRYGAEDGAPVAVFVPGGFTAGTLEVQAGLFLKQGFVVVTFLFPGGIQGPYRSDGVYDDRGDHCHRALRDVLRFAASDLASAEGKFISQYLGGPARKDAVGILALSNGGSISAATLGRYGEQIPPLGFLIPWESPTNDQVLAAEVGSKEYDPDPLTDSDGDGLPNNEGQNPAYTSYGFPSCNVDYSRLRYASDYTYRYKGGTRLYQGLFYFDNNGNHRFDAEPAGSLLTDLNHNGRIDPLEDYPLPGLMVRQPDGSQLAYLSTPAAEQAVRVHLADPWPAHIADVVKTRAYWDIRNANLYFSQIAAKQPGLAGMSVYSLTDHVQVAPDHPHVHHYLDGFRQNGLWYRLNPDAAYVYAIAGTQIALATDNEANRMVRPEEMRLMAEPLNGGIVTPMLQAAALAEMADRCRYRRWSANLTTLIHPGVGMAPPSTIPATVITTTTGITTTSLVSTTSTTSTSSTSTTLPSTVPGRKFLTFALNCHDWVHPRQSAETIAFFLDTLDSAGVPGELYLTAPLVEALVREAPDLVQRIRRSSHTVSYHVRAPHPALFEPTQELLKEYTLEQYERCRLDMSTGHPDCSQKGGFAYVSEVFGRTPSSLGVSTLPLDLRSQYAALLAARGARMMVFEHSTEGQTGWDSLLQPRHGLYPRPADYFLARTNSNGHAAEEGDFWWNRISKGSLTVENLVASFRSDFLNTNDLSVPVRFGIVVIHENDFYSHGVAWAPMYFQSPAEGGSPLPPPYDLNRTGSWIQPRAAEEQQAIRHAFSAMVTAATAAPETQIVTSREIARLADAQFPAGHFPESRQEWFQEPGLEKDLPAGYEFRSGSLPGDEGDAPVLIRFSESAAHSGNRGLLLDAGTDGNTSLQVRVDLDKGQGYRFSGWTAGYGSGNISFSLIPVAWGVSGLMPVNRNPIVTTSPLSGSFGWTQWQADSYILENYDYCLLRIEIRGGGRYFLDDISISSVEHTPLVFPEQPKEKIRIGFLVHIEDIFSLRSDTPYYRAKTQIIKDLAELFHRHGACMNLQTELDWVLGAERMEPGLLARLHRDYAVDFSVHTHGPKGPNPSESEVLDYIAERKLALETASGSAVTDLNGNFDLSEWSLFASIGMKSMSAFKNASTQAGYQGHYVHPWRPSPGNPFLDEAAWAVPNPSGAIVYVPGECKQVTKFHSRLQERVLPGLSFALANASAGELTTWYFIGHVDSFSSKEGLDHTTYILSEQYRQDMMYYERLLTDILDPLVARGYAEWSTPARMQADFEAR